MLSDTFHKALPTFSVMKWEVKKLVKKIGYLCTQEILDKNRPFVPNVRTLTLVDVKCLTY